MWGSGAEDVYAVGNCPVGTKGSSCTTRGSVNSPRCQRTGLAVAGVQSTVPRLASTGLYAGYMHDYDVGTIVTLTAMPEVPAIFDSWSGDCTGYWPLCRHHEHAQGRHGHVHTLDHLSPSR